MQDKIYRELWLFQRRRVPPIDIVDGSQLAISLELMDYTVPAGATAKAFARPWAAETTYEQTATVDGNTVTFTSPDGFFRPGGNSLQIEINGNKIPLSIDVNCGTRLSDGGDGSTPEAVRPLVERAEEAAQKAEDALAAVPGAVQTAAQPLVSQAQSAARAASASATAAAASAESVKASAEQIAANKEAIETITPDDTAIDGKPWTSKKIVDVLYPPIEETGNPVQCYPVTGYPLDVTASWEPVQEGSGDPSLENIRPIRGRDSVTITRQEDNQVITLTLPETVYGGKADAVSGEGEETWKLAALDGTKEWFTWGVNVNNATVTGFYCFDINDYNNEDANVICSHLPRPNDNDDVWGGKNEGVWLAISGSHRYLICSVKTKILDDASSNANAITSWKAYLAAQYAAGTPVQVCYKLAEPVPFTATGAQPLPALSGVNTVLTDADTLTVKARENRPQTWQEIEEIGGEVEELREDVENLETIVDKYSEQEISTQLFDREKCTIGLIDLNGKIYSGGNYDAYFYTDYIPVGNNVGRKIIISQNKSETDVGEYVQSEARYVVAFDPNGVPIDNLGGSNIGEYTVPDGVSKIRICINATKPIFWQAEYDLRSGVRQEYYSLSPEIKSFAIGKQKTYIRKYKTLPGTRVQNAGVNIPNKKNDVISFFGKFTQFIGLEIGIGYKMIYGSWVSIGLKTVELYSNSGTLVISKEHGLTISEFISVTIARKNNKNQALIVITTTSGTFSVQWDFQGSNGDVFVMPNYSMTECTLSYNMKDINADVFAFGDSYMTLGDSARYPKYILERGYTNMMMIGYGGISTKEMLPIFRRVLDIYKPKYVVWCLGMNDTSDETTWAPDWKNGIDEVLSACNHNNIVPILATIPCVPSIDHTKKNEYIKNSGWRYVDFAKAVGAETAGSSWYDGMLSGDNVHPTALGAQALASRFMVDVPEAFEGF